MPNQPVEAPLTQTPAALRWHALKPPPGGSLRGFYCGRLRAFECHWVQESNKPCRVKISGGKLECYCKSEPLSLRTIAYVPIETKEQEQLAVIVPKTTALMVASFKHGDPLEFSRAKRDKSPVRARMILAEEIGTQRGGVIQKQQPRDIFEYLLHLWGDVALQRYFSSAESPASATQPNLLRVPRKAAAKKAQPATANQQLVAMALAGIGSPTGA